MDDNRRDTDPIVVPKTLVVACAALTRELRTVLGQFGFVDVVYLPSPLHNRPEKIPAAVASAINEAVARQLIDRIVVAYADCGTGGLLDMAIQNLRVSTGKPIMRLPGAHCYEFFAGAVLFAELHDAEPGTFYLTDYLAKHFDALVWSGLGLDRHPQLRDTYFGNYQRVVLLSQSDDAGVVNAARSAATRLNLAFEHHHVGLDPFAVAVSEAMTAPSREERS